METIKLLEELKKDLSLLDCFDNQIEAIKATHLAEIKSIELFYVGSLKALQPKPKRAIAKKPKEQPLKVEITEAGKTTEVIFQTEKECETFLKLKHKQRLKTAQSPDGLSVPTQYGYSLNAKEKYIRECAEYWQAAKDQNLDFTVKISRV